MSNSRDLISSPVIRGRVGRGQATVGCKPISDHDDLFHREIDFAALPLLYPPPYDGGGDKRFAGVPTATLIVNLLPCA